MAHRVKMRIKTASWQGNEQVKSKIRIYSLTEIRYDWVVNEQ
jgi:hypothetical protein